MRIVTGRGAMNAGDPLVELLLLLLFGVAAVGEGQHLGAEQPHALGAVLLDQTQVAHQAAVRGEADAPPVARLGGSICAARRGARRSTS